MISPSGQGWSGMSRTRAGLDWLEPVGNGGWLAWPLRVPHLVSLVAELRDGEWSERRLE